MILRAAIPGGESALKESQANVLLFLVLALILHFAFFLVWDKTEAVNPFELEPISEEALGIPLELILELGSLPPEEASEASPNLNVEAQALHPEAIGAAEAPAEAPPPQSPDANTDNQAQENPADPALTEAAQEASRTPAGREMGEPSFPLSRSAALLGEALSPRRGPEGISSGVDNTINVEESAPSAKSYDIAIRTAVARLWILPPEARNNFRPARFTASMTLDPLGQIILIMVEESSGNSILDHAAMEALRGAAPYEPFPANLSHLDRMTFRIHFDYKAVVKSGLPGK
jgi:TonB family protein